MGEGYARGRQERGSNLGLLRGRRLNNSVHKPGQRRDVRAQRRDVLESLLANVATLRPRHDVIKRQ